MASAVAAMRRFREDITGIHGWNNAHPGAYDWMVQYTVDGVVEPIEATGMASSTIHQRLAFDVFTICDPQRIPITPLQHKYEQVRQQERQVQRDLARQRRQGIISCSEYTAAARASNSRRVAAYHPGYLGPCSFAGDRFHPVMLTPHGGWWEWGHGGGCNEFLQRKTN